jgi:membrane dipeptidase
MQITYTDHRQDPGAWAKSLGISREAIDIYLASEVIDLHIDSFIWNRVFGYDLRKRHGKGLLGGRVYSQADIPRLREANIAGGLWSITTNPLRSSKGRADVFARNIKKLVSIFDTVPNDVAVARNLPEYLAARKKGLHVAMLSIQGGNALDRDKDVLDIITDDLIVRITLVHLSTSTLGSTSAPSMGKRVKDGLTNFGKEYVKRLNDRRILVDLAHINRAGFFDAVSVHDKTQPLIVTHTGINAVTDHWRNLDDEQIKTIANSGGTIGIMYQSPFLGGPFLGCKSVQVVDHLEHIIKVVGEDHASLGSDWDGAIIPPADMPTCLELPRLVQHMVDRNWKPERIEKILGKNFLRVLGHIRGTQSVRVKESA